MCTAYLAQSSHNQLVTDLCFNSSEPQTRLIVVQSLSLGLRLPLKVMNAIPDPDPAILWFRVLFGQCVLLSQFRTLIEKRQMCVESYILE